MICDEKERLFVEYKQAVREWLESAHGLNEKSATICYDHHALDQVEEVRFRAFRTKARYVKHLADHGCY